MTDESDVGAATQPDADVNNNNSEFNIPEAYKSEGWTQNLKSYDDLWKMSDNAQKLIGRKSMMPDEGASDAEWQSFYGKMRPASQEDYAIDLDDEEAKAYYAKAFFDNGISKKQASALISAYKQEYDKQTEKMFSQSGYDEEMSNRFGDKAKETAQAVTELLKKELSEADRKALDAMPNNVLGALYSAVNTLRERYAIKDSDIAASAPQTGVSGQPDYAGYAKALNELTHRPHDSADVANLRAKYNIK